MYIKRALKHDMMTYVYMNRIKTRYDMYNCTWTALKMIYTAKYLIRI